MKGTVPLANFSTLGDLLKFLRRRAQLSQRELAIAVGYSESHLSRIESNDRPLDRSSVLALFVPALHLQNEPEIVKLLLALCAEPSATKSASPVAIAAQSGVPSLPSQLTSFVGRSEEIAELCDLLVRQHKRLLTLTGVGGCGKTRLALRMGEELATHYEHGVWLVEFAAQSDPQLVAKSVATGLGLSQNNSETPIADLIQYLSSRRLLLVLDNCEHLVEAVAELVVMLLQHCLQLQIVTTSREVLAIAGEFNYRVQPLALPPMQRGVRPLCSQIADYDAVQLFVERAGASLHTFALSDQNAPAVAHICQRLDGIPLGIELAAAWVNLLSPEQIASRLAKNLDLLVDSSRSTPSRHQTLRAAIDWSYNLLTEAEHTILRRVSIFAGGWNLESAEAVIVDEEARALQPDRRHVLKLLGQLVNKSLVVVDHSDGGEARFRLLEPLGEYLKEKLSEAGEEQFIAHHHLRYFATLAEQLIAQRYGAAGRAALTSLNHESDNLRAALTWGFTLPLASRLDQLRAISLAAQLGRYWYIRQDWSEGRGWLTKALATLESLCQERSLTSAAQSEMPALRAKLLLQLGYLAGGQGDLPEAQKWLEQSLTLHRCLADDEGIVRTLHELGTIASEQGNYNHATALLTESLDHACILKNDWLYAISLGKLADVAGEQNDYVHCEELGGECLKLAQQLDDMGMRIIALNLLAQCAMATHRFPQAVIMLEEAIALNQQSNPHSKGSPWALRNLGLALQLAGDYAHAADYYRRSLLLRSECQQTTGMAWALEGLGEVMALCARPVHAAKIWGAADMLRHSVGSVMSNSDRLRNEPMVASVFSQLGSENFEKEWAEGESMSTEEIVEFVLRL